jgi:hypothetical protein
VTWSSVSRNIPHGISFAIDYFDFSWKPEEQGPLENLDVGGSVVLNRIIKNGIRPDGLD